MAGSLGDALIRFSADNGFRGKGSLSVALVVTQHARAMGLPLDPKKLITDGEGQVLGLGKGAVQAILKRHGIERVLAAEGGRTSRGSLGNMREYVEFLNDLQKNNLVNLDLIEKYWIERVNEFFAGKPFKIKLDASRSLRAVVRDVIEQAEARQKTMPGVYYAGAVIQHLVGAKLDRSLGEGAFEHNSYSTADAPSGRAGDFFIGDVAIHVTTSPGEALLGRCEENLNDGFRPVIVTTRSGVAVAEGLARNKGLSDRVDVFEVEQFVALGLYEIGKFATEGRRLAVNDLVARYNAVVEEVETDPSLKIEIKK